MIGLMHWAPNGGKTAICGLVTEDVVASMGPVNCIICRRHINNKIESLKHVPTPELISRNSLPRDAFRKRA